MFAASVTTNRPKQVDALHELRWLPVQSRIKFKLAYLTFKVMHTGTPLYCKLSSHVFLFHAVLLVFSGHLPPLISYKSSALTLFSVPALSAQLLQVFRTLFPTHSVNLVHVHSFRRHIKIHLYQAALNTPYSGMLQHLRFTYMTNSAS